MFKVVAIVSVVAALLSPDLTRAQPAMPAARGVPVPAATTLTAKRVSLTITLLRKVIYPGSPVLVSAVFRNNGKRKFEVSGWPVRFTFNVISAESLKTGKSAAPTRCMIHTPQAWSFHIFTRLVVLPGRAKTFWKQIDFARYYDLTMPGKYRFLVQAGRLKSNVVTVKVAPLPTPQAQPALTARAQTQVTWPAGISSLQVILRQVKWKIGSPLQARVFIRYGGGHPKSVRLTGDPFLDLRVARAEGPDGINGDELVKKPHPHWIPIPNKTPVPLTAYGKWLTKQKPPKNLRLQTYTLKPGAVYEYAEPVNLSCRYDLSLSGVYRVRVRLAHTKIWSPWAKITVRSR